MTEYRFVAFAQSFSKRIGKFAAIAATKQIGRFELSYLQVTANCQSVEWMEYNFFFLQLFASLLLLQLQLASCPILESASCWKNHCTLLLYHLRHLAIMNIRENFISQKKNQLGSFIGKQNEMHKTTIIINQACCQSFVCTISIPGLLSFSY